MLSQGALPASADVAVVGGGLAGLTGATFLARSGRSVVLCEKGADIGGRARTQTEKGFCFNLGPHALFVKGAGVQVLKELGVRFSGQVVTLADSLAFYRGAIHKLPTGPPSLFTTSLFGPVAKMEAGRIFGSLPGTETDCLQGTTVRAWLERAARRPEVRELLAAMIRLATYANDPERQSAGAALAQLQLATAGSVYYLDGGWQTLVDGLRNLATEAGAQIFCKAKVAAVETGGAARSLRLENGTALQTGAVLLATGLMEAAALVQGGPGAVMAQWAASAIPVRASCLDVALRRLPQPRARFALGIDRPLYLSVHSTFAKLAPENGAIIHVAKYLESSPPSDPGSVERELEDLLEQTQPGWRQEVTARRFLPNMVVSNALVTAAEGGTTGRPAPPVPGVRNLYVAGDWVGPEGMLADAALASARRAAELLARDML